MTAASVNMHYHGTNAPPVCHQDEVIHTLINSGETFPEYDLKIPKDEPPGLYWYHPHVHGISEEAVQGRASGALIVDGIQNASPDVAGLEERLLVIRDNPVPGNPTDKNVPVGPFRELRPCRLSGLHSSRGSNAGRTKQFWQVLNTSADTILDLVLLYNEAQQPVEVVALDGVPTNSQDGQKTGNPIRKNHILLPPAARVEFIMVSPWSQVERAVLLTRRVATGPDRHNAPGGRSLRSDDVGALEALPVFPPVWAAMERKRLSGLATATPVATRKLYFSGNHAIRVEC